MRSRQAGIVAALVAVGLALVLVPAALAGNGGVAPPPSATESGTSIKELWWILMAILGAIFVLVEGALLYFVFRFRRRRGTSPHADGPQIHGHTKLELVWTAIPLAILIVIMVVTIVKVPNVQANPKPGSDALVVDVAAHQFYWEYTYPNGVVTVDELRVPVGRPVQLRLNAIDVIHSWWVPALTGKLDAIPGRTNTLNFTVDRTGSFSGQCAELCGAQHAVMRTTVVALDGGAFDQWYAQTAQAQAAGGSGLGEQTWDGVCAKCHGELGEGDYGPQIAGNSTLVDEQALGQLLENGQDTKALAGYMPGVGRGWPAKQLRALIAYVKSNPDLAPQQGAQQGG
jgi:cytochrome c oxidase subunit 2